MTSVFVVLIGTIVVLTVVFPMEAINVECFMCDNDAEDETGDCEKNPFKNTVTCTGESCSVTSYVRNTATGRQSSP